MHQLDEGFAAPDACVQWCRSRPYPLQVLDDGSAVDLDWWNRHLEQAGHEIRLRGRDPDGRVVEHGSAVVQRNDLRLDSDLIESDHRGLGLLFLCAAWRTSHRDRRGRRQLPDVFDPYATGKAKPLDKIKRVLDHCAIARQLPAPTGADTWAGWPQTPGVGVPLMALYLWAVGASTEGGGRAQLIDQNGVSTLLHEGWLEEPSVSGFTLRRYDRYLQLLHEWAAQAETHPELVETWLVQRWNARLVEGHRGARAEPTLF